MTDTLRATGLLLLVLALPTVGCGNETCDLFADPSCIDGDALMADVAWLAAPEQEGRQPGSAGNRAAVTRVAERFAAAGLDAPRPDYRQTFGLPIWRPLVPPTLAFEGAPLTLGADFETLTFVEDGVAEGELVFVGHGLSVPPFDPVEWPDCPYDPAGRDDWAGVDLTGKVVLVLAATPPAGFEQCPEDPLCEEEGIRCYGTLHATLKAQAAGAEGVLATLPDLTRDAPTPFGRVGSSARLAPLPALLVGGPALTPVLPDLGAWVADAAARRPATHPTGLQVSLAVTGTVTVEPVDNVLGVLPGADPVLGHEVVVVGAHLDHLGTPPFQSVLYPGADDNASGTAVVLELARAVAASPTRPARTLLFAAWNAEEQGLVGSCHYVYQEPVFPLTRTVAAFSVDMVGAGRPDLDLYGGTAYPGLVDLARNTADGWGLEGSFNALGRLYASDHACFDLEGVPGLLASTASLEDHPYYHQPGDTAGHIDRETLEAAAALVWAAVQPLALGEPVGD